MRIIVLFLLLTLYTLSNFSQTVVPFSLRFTTSAKGSIEFVSNASLHCDGTGGGGANCSDLDTELPPFFDSWSQNNDHNAEYIDIDSDPTTFSSSSDSIDLPLCSRIAYAAIYWGGRADDDDPGFGARGNIKIGVNGLGYTDITADTIVDAGAAEGLGNRVYYCFAEITDLLDANPIQSLYTVANVYSRLGGNNRWGGWNIVVVYEYDLLPMRNLSVFDGLVNVNNVGTDVEVGISGFLTPPIGPVTFDVGVFGYDGDRGFTGDSLLFDGGAGYVPISNALNPADDIFNFSQSKSGIVSTSQVPLIHNNISIDADIFTPDNSGFAYIGNSETSANIKVTTNNETVQVQVLTIAIDVYEPDIRAGVRVEDINGGLLEPGDTLEYTVMGTNIGSDPAVNSFILDTLADNIEYVPESIEIIYGPNLGAKTDADGDDQARYISVDNVIRVNIGVGADAFSGGVVPNSPAGVDSTVFKFRAVVIEDCVLLSCQNIVENQAYIFGTGAVSGNELSNQSDPGVFDENGCALDGTTSIAIDISDCPLPADTAVSDYCDGVLFGDFPFDEIGYEYYDDLFSSVTEASGAGTYYAIREAYAGCADTVVITITSFYDAPTTSNAGPDQTVCDAPGTATLAGNNPVSGTGVWTVTAGGGTVTSPTTFNSGVTGLTVGANTFVWTITNGVDCPPSIDEVTIMVTESPSIANAGPDQTVCLVPGTATLAGNDPAVGTGVWTVTAGGATVTSPTAFNSGVTGLTVGTNTFVWTITNGPSCPPSFDAVNIVILPSPTTANAGPDQTVCIDPGTATLAGNDPALGTGLWTVSAGGGTVTSPTAFNSGVTGLTVGVNTFVWTITNDVACAPSTDAVTIIVTDEPTAAAAGPDQVLCLTTTTTLDGNNPVIGTGLWTVIAGGGTVTTPTAFNSGVTGLTLGVNTFRWTITSGLCSPSFDEVNIILDTDWDGDGICDAVDLDDDNDGIPDLEEGDADTDGDGIPDSLDLDSDNDGIPDVIEAGGTDDDGDGIIDGFEDLDGDGLDDATALDPLENPDSDGDGVVDAHDLDADNDGTPDVIEAGGTDVDGDGILDGYVDVDGDGFSDMVDGTEGGIALDNPDTDGDGVDDRLDLDSDNDGIPDVIENGGTDADGDGILDGYTDVDGDGFADSVDTDDNTVPGPGDGGTSLPNGDADFDGIPNAQDLDSDNDGILDIIEAGGVDTDGDGQIDGYTDIDGDGYADVVDTDDNTIPGAGDGGTALDVPNTDGTGGPDFLDIDADGDGIVDNIEGQSTGGYTPPTGTDSDGDGIDDAYDVDAGGTPIGDYDHDGDGNPDYTDLDSDNDGESDLLEGHDTDGDGVADTVPTGTDSDNDGLDDAFDTVVLDAGTAFTNAGNGTVDPLTDGVIADADAPGVGDLDFRERDNDEDGIPDDLDLDDDNDGIPDLVEDLDEDGDGDPTTNPTDTDGDGIIDIFDLDSDNDGIPDIVEAGGTDDNEDGRVDDLNPDGTLVNDTDNDGLDDLYDADNGGADIPNPDTDGDGHSDFQDVDSDNDGIYDIVEDGGVDEDNDGRVDDWLDSDGDGIPDYADVDATGGIDLDGDGIDDAVQVGDDEDGDGIADDFDEDANGDGWDDDDATNGLEDTDGDGVFDRLDLDSDNDGTPDIIEDGGVDENGDGRIDDFTDLDGDGADDDSMTDGLDDFDGDGVPDHEDLDSDNDGITDAEENGKPDEDGDGIIDDFTDLDGDGWDDDHQTTEQTDTDGDGIPDDTDLDSDNDGILDIIEGGGTDINGDGVIDDFEDENGDGLDDTDGGVNPPDTDGDGIDDYQDLDSDNDGVPDVEENDPSGDGSGPDDTDGDGIPDYQDTDDDNDGVLTENESDKDENGVYTDCDSDGIPDYLDPDPCGLTIPTGFSPDGDGINDFFVIEGIQGYPNASITIYNRWGNKVFESMNGYNNDWDGTNQFGMTVGERNLPVGTYFYVLDLGDRGEVIKGYVFINR
jgi:gliding motility-associated-like protein/uncharacterized repeat protein (TIGR01451 family)